MAITKEQAIDILDKFDFFQGQRAGRELWNDKPFEVQEQDIKNFSNDVALLKEYISDVVPKSEYEQLKAMYEDNETQRAYTINMLGESLENAKSEIEMLQGALKAEEQHNELTMEMAQKALKNAKAEVARTFRKRMNEKMGKHTHLLGKEYVQRIMREVEKDMCIVYMI